MITEKELLDFGFKHDDENPFIPYEKKLIEVEDSNGLSLVVTVMRNMAELALLLPCGGFIYLGGVKTIEDLQVLERSITDYEYPY